MARRRLSNTVSADHTGVTVLSADDLEQAAALLRLGNLVAFPTDTFFALGAVLTGPAIAALFQVKRRMTGNPVPVLLSSVEQVPDVAASFPHLAVALAEAFWPGPLTLVLPARDDVPDGVTAGTGTVGVRVPDHQLARELISRVGGPVTGTSANLSGSPPCKRASDVLTQLGEQIRAVIDAPCGDHSAPSTVVGFSGDAGQEIRVIRTGAISEADLRRVMGSA